MKFACKLIIIMTCLSQLFCDTSTAVFPPIREVAVAGNNNLWVITNKNELFHLTESGQEKIEIDFNIKPRKVFFINDKEGWVLDSHGRIWFTQDMGKIWNKRGNIDHDNNVLQSELVFVNKQIGWLTVGLSILLTEDGGSSWKQIYPTAELSYTSLSSVPIKIFPVNTNILWVSMSNGKILKTIDRGKNWDHLTTNTSFDIKTLFVIDDERVWVGCWGEGGVYYSNNGGKTWVQMLDNETKKNLGVSSITFQTENIGWIVSRNFVNDLDLPNKSNGVILKTVNQGKSWVRLEGDFYKQPFNKIIFTDSDSGWIISDDTIFQTSDGGENWQTLFSLD